VSGPPKPSRRSVRRAASIVGVAVLLAPLAIYPARKIIAREALVGWLQDHGVTSQVDIAGLRLDRLSGGIRAGDAKVPDFVAGDVAVTYGLRGLTFEVRSVTLRGAVLRARLHDGRVSLGSLDRLVAEFAKRPPRPNEPGPRIEIDRGILLLATDYGPVRLAVDATVKDGRLIALAARSDPARLSGGGGDIVVGRASATLHTAGDRVALTLDAPIANLRTGNASATAARLQLQGDAPYPDLKRKRSDGAVTLHAGFTGQGLMLAGGRLDSPRLDADFRGRMSGWTGDFGLSGAMAGDLRGSAAAMGGLRLGPVRAAIKAEDLRWTRTGGDAVSATPQVTALLQEAAGGGLRLSQVLVAARGPVTLGRTGARAALAASLDGHGAWTGLGPAKAADGPEFVAVKRAAQGFQVAAPAMTVELNAAALRLALPQPLRLRADSGGLLTVSGRAGAPAIGAGGGALGLAMRGGGLPNLDADLRRLQVARGVFTAQVEARATGSLGPAEGAALDASGALRIADGTVSFAADRCVPLSARKVVFGANDLAHFAGRLCPPRGPMFALARDGWRLRAQVDGLTAEAPFLQARIAGGAGSVIAEQAAGRASVTAVLAEAKVLDEARQTRFNALQLAGTARLADDRWGATFRSSTPAGKPMMDGVLRHNARTGQGGLTLDTGMLTFAEGGLQPSQLSPLAQAVGSPAVGRAAFAGRMDWTPQGVTSSGTLSVPDLDFTSPAGKVAGLKAVVAFTSLAPLVTAPGQTLSAERLDAIVPATGLSATFGLDASALTLTGGEASVGGGRARLESLTVPLAAEAATVGVLVLDGVQVHDLVAASPFGDRVALDAKVSGRVPFRTEAGKVRVAGAELHAIEAGRLSISRQALTGVAANDTFTDFAYQAMENLAFDKLEATIASRDDGRLGILAHVVGRHDPPQRQEIRLSLFDLIGRKFLNRPLPLPSDTGVDLTLDTTLNLDDLVGDYANYQALRGSHPVQPPAPKTETKPLETPR
jgi:Dicarboxylate transport